ncbi:MAG TPA: hypothetical protein VLX92_32340 [Kofleriaceae bacterium]|nr:hypothetical protein [Kofleriaceae bacterium]
MTLCLVVLGGCACPGERYVDHGYASPNLFKTEIAACTTQHACDALCTRLFSLGSSDQIESCKITLLDQYGGARVDVHYVNNSVCAADDGGEIDVETGGTVDDGGDGGYDDGSDDGSCDDGSCDDGGSDDGSSDDGSSDGGDGGDDGDGGDGGDDGGDYLRGSGSPIAGHHHSVAPTPAAR